MFSPSQQREYYERNKEKLKAQARAWYHRHKPKWYCTVCKIKLDGGRIAKEHRALLNHRVQKKI